MARKHTQKKLSGWDRYDAIMNAGGAPLVLLVLALLAMLLGYKCLGWAKGDADKWEDRPQEVVEAELRETSSRRSKDSPSEWLYSGRYVWEYQGSSGSFWNDKEYEQEHLVPETKRVHIYLETDDTWHLMGPHGEGVVSAGYLVIGGTALLLGGAAIALFSLLMLKGSLSERISAGKNRPNATTNSTSPMARFACEACNEYLDSIPADERAAFKDTRKVRRGLGVAKGREVYLIHDATLFKSGKDGFAITDAGFSCRDMGEKQARLISWAELARAERPRVEDSHVLAGDLDLVYFSGESGYGPSELLLELCQLLWQQAREAAAR